MVFCLRANRGRTLFGWFDLTPDEKQALIDMLNTVLGEEVEINMEGLRKMFEAFLTMTNPTTMDDRDGSSWANVANNVTQIKELKFDNDGRRAWYLALKKDGDLDWEEGKPEPDKAQQYFLTKLRKIAARGVKHLEVMEKRWAKGEELVTWYKSFRKIANTRGPGQTVLNLQLGTVKMEKVLDDIRQGNKEVNSWADGISNYFGVPRIGEYQDAMKFFFPVAGFELEDKIDRVKLKNLIENKNIEAVKLVSDEIKAADQMDEVSTTLTTLGDTMLKIKR